LHGSGPNVRARQISRFQIITPSGYATNFIDLSGLFLINGSGDTATNYVDLGGATNWPARFYRSRLVPRLVVEASPPSSRSGVTSLKVFGIGKENPRRFRCVTWVKNPVHPAFQFD
jgi:hypothetical protein